MLDVILVRHAEVELPWKSICYGAMDVPLSIDGRAASEKLAADIAVTHRPTAIYHSGLARTAYLAELIRKLCPSIPMMEETRLRERDYGDWQGMTWDEVFQSDRDHFHDLIDDPDRYRPPGGETTTEMQARMVKWLEELKNFQNPSTIIVVSHSGPIAALAGYCLKLHARDWGPWTLKNLEGIKITVPQLSVERLEASRQLAINSFLSPM